MTLCIPNKLLPDGLRQVLCYDYHLNDAGINPYDPVVGGALQAATPMGRGIFTNNDCEHERETITGS